MTIKTQWLERTDRSGGGAQLREAYLARGLTREQAAAAIDVSVVRLWLLETGEVTMTEAKMWDEAIAKIRAAPPGSRPFWESDGG